MAQKKQTAKKSLSRVTKEKPRNSKAAVKKAVKKIVSKKEGQAKKTAPKKKTQRRRVLIIAPRDKCFWTRGGAVLKDLRDLRRELLSMDRELFMFHASGETNHFVPWVEGVLCDPDCAKALKAAKTQKTAARKVEEALKKYT
jgi:hypothetical protein